MRDLILSENNEFNLYDRASNSTIKLFYRTPTTEERIQYKSALVNVTVKSKDAADIIKTQLEWGKKILTGFAEDSFCVNGKPISSDEKSENYHPGWKDAVAETASDILLTFVEFILDAPNYAIKGDSIPFGNNSGNS